MSGTVPTARLCDTKAEKNAKLRRGSKLRAIDKGTIYDVAGRLRKCTREIESGALGEVTDVVMALRYLKDGNVGLRTMFTGKSQPEVLHYLARKLEKEVLS